MRCSFRQYGDPPRTDVHQRQACPSPPVQEDPVHVRLQARCHTALRVCCVCRRHHRHILLPHCAREKVLCAFTHHQVAEDARGHQEACEQRQSRRAHASSRSWNGHCATPRVESDLVTWINNLRRDDIPVSNLMLQLKAIELADNPGFAASPSWKASFLSRHKLSFRARNRAGQSEPDADHVLGETFAREVVAWMREHGVTRVYNADQPGVQFEMLPKKTVSARGAQVVWVRCGSKEKQRATAMLLADSDGNKYKVFLVFKAGKSTIPEMQEENDRLCHGIGRGIWEEAKTIQDQLAMEVYGNPTAWWNSDITVAWLEFHFGKRSHSDDPILLLLDSFSGHWTEDVLATAARLNVKLKAVPPKLT